MKRLLMATVAMLVAVAWAGAATAAAQTQTGHRLQRRDATTGHGGSPAGRPGAQSRLRPLRRSSTGRRCRQVGRRRRGAAGGTATVAGGTLTVDGARANPTALYDAGRSLDFAATFTADPFQHVGFGETFEDAPWAMFSTGGGALAVGLYARTALPGGPAENTPIAGVDPLVEHDYSIEWTPTEVRYFVDGDLVATHAIAIDAQMRPVASDFTVGGGSVAGRVLDLDLYLVSDLRHVHVARLRRRRQPRHLADADRGAGHPGRDRRDVRGPHRKHADAGRLVDRLAAGRRRRRDPGPLGRRYLQYRATLTTTDTQRHAVRGERHAGYDVDTAAPAATIGGVTVSGSDRPGHVLERGRGPVRVQPRQRAVPGLHQPEGLHGPVGRLAHA